MPIYMNWGGDVDPPYPPKIKGTATDVDHPDWIELDSLQWSTPPKPRALDSSVDREGIVDVGDLIVTKRQDNTSNLLFRESNGGQP